MYSCRQEVAEACSRAGGGSSRSDEGQPAHSAQELGAGGRRHGHAGQAGKQLSLYTELRRGIESTCVAAGGRAQRLAAAQVVAAADLTKDSPRTVPKNSVLVVGGTGTLGRQANSCHYSQS